MDKLCEKCRDLAFSYPPLKENQTLYNKILLDQNDYHAECLKALLETGADVNVAKSRTGKALIYAARRGHVKRLQALIAAGADVNTSYKIVYHYEQNVVDPIEYGNALTNAV